MSVRDADGTLRSDVFNKYDFLELNKEGEWYYNDDFIFATDPAGDFAGDRENMWNENRENYRSGVYGAPGSDEALRRFWQNMERDRYPHAREILASFDTGGGDAIR